VGIFGDFARTCSLLSVIIPPGELLRVCAVLYSVCIPVGMFSNQLLSDIHRHFRPSNYRRAATPGEVKKVKQYQLSSPPYSTKWRVETGCLQTQAVTHRDG
jgi:hypothetical protein